MTIFKEWFVIISLVERILGSPLGVSGFHYELRPSTIQPGEHAVLTLSVPLDPQEEDGSVQIFDDLLMQQQNFSVLEKTSERSQSALKIRYELTAYKDSRLTLPPIAVKKNGASFSTESQPLLIQSRRNEGDMELREGFGTLKIPLPWWKGVKWALTALTGLALLLWAYHRLKALPWNRLKKLRLQLPKRPVLENHEVWLRTRLQQIKNRLEKEGAHEFILDEWTSVIREYYERTTQSPARAWTTKELKRNYSQKASFTKLAPCFESCDSFRFRRYDRVLGQIGQLIQHCIKETEQSILLCGS